MTYDLKYFLLLSEQQQKPAPIDKYTFNFT